MIKLARIIKIDKDEVILKLQQKAACSDCKGGCSGGFLDFIFHRKNHDILSVALDKHIKGRHLVDGEKFFSTGSYKKDDIVGIELFESQVMQFALLLYGLPIVLVVSFLIAGAFLFEQIGLNPDFGGISGFLIGLIISRQLLKSKPLHLAPKIRFFK